MDNGYDYKECIGLKVKPRQGDALLFYSIHPNGTFDMVFPLLVFSSLISLSLFGRDARYIVMLCDLGNSHWRVSSILLTRDAS